MTAKFLRELELSSYSYESGLAGAYYEALYNEHMGLAEITEGAPFDGKHAGSSLMDWRTVNAHTETPFFMMNINDKPGKIFEMKKLRLATQKCHFNNQNVNACLQLDGDLIGSAILADADEIEYRRAKDWQSLL